MFGIWWLTSTKRKKYVIKDYNGTTEKIRHFTTSRQKSPSNVIRSSRLSSNSLSLRVALSRDFHLLRMCINFASFFCVSHSQRLALFHVQQIIKTGIYYIKQTLTSRHKWSGENSLIKWVGGEGLMNLLQNGTYPLLSYFYYFCFVLSRELFSLINILSSCFDLSRVALWVSMDIFMIIYSLSRIKLKRRVLS